MNTIPEPRPDGSYAPVHRNENTRGLTDLRKVRFMLIKEILEKRDLNPSSEDIFEIMKQQLRGGKGSAQLAFRPNPIEVLKLWHSRKIKNTNPSMTEQAKTRKKMPNITREQKIQVMRRREILKKIQESSPIVKKGNQLTLF